MFQSKCTIMCYTEQIMRITLSFVEVIYNVLEQLEYETET